MKKDIRGIYKINNSYVDKDVYIIAYFENGKMKYEYNDNLDKVLEYTADYCNSKKYDKKNLQEELKNDPNFDISGKNYEEIEKMLEENYKDESNLNDYKIANIDFILDNTDLDASNRQDLETYKNKLTNNDEEELDDDEEKGKLATFKDNVNDKLNKISNTKVGKVLTGSKKMKKLVIAGVAVMVAVTAFNIGKGLLKLNRDNTPTRTTTREFTLNDDKDNDLDNNNNKNKENNKDNNTKEQENAVKGNEVKEETKKENTNATSTNTAVSGSATNTNHSNNSTGTTVAGSSYDNGSSYTNTNSNTDTSTTVSGSDATSNSSENTSGSDTQPQEDNTQSFEEGNGDFQDPNVTIDDVEEPTLPTDNEQTTSEDNTYTEEETYQEENTNTMETPSQEIEVEAPVVEDETTPPTEEVEEDINLDDVQLNDKFENIEDIENAIGDDITIGDNEVTLTEDQEMTTPDENAAALGYDDVYTEEVPVEQPETPSQEIEVEPEAEQSVAPTEEVSEPVVEEQTIEEVPVEQTSPASEEITVEAPEVEVTAPVETEVQSSTPEEASYEEEVPVYQNDQVADAIVNAMENGENITYNPETGEISSQPTYDVNETSLTK